MIFVKHYKKLEIPVLFWFMQEANKLCETAYPFHIWRKKYFWIKLFTRPTRKLILIFLKESAFQFESISLITARKRSLRRLCFYRCLSVHGGGGAWLQGVGACVAAGDVHGCRGACMVAQGMRGWWWGGVMCGCRGACVVVGGACMVAGGHAWLLGGVHGCGGGACIGYGEIRSMSGRYASYWNAFFSKAR